MGDRTQVFINHIKYGSDQTFIILISESIILDQARSLVEDDQVPEEFLQTANDLDDIAQRYKDEIRNQTVSPILYHRRQMSIK